MNISTLESFVLLAENKNFSKTASLLNTTQPNLSKRIRLLEKEFGFDLFVRDTRSVELTQAGKIIYSGVVGILSSLQDCIEEARWQSSHEKPVVEIGGNLANIKIAAAVERAISYAANNNYPFQIKPNRAFNDSNPLEAGSGEPLSSILEGNDHISLLFTSKSVYSTSLVVVPLYKDFFALYVSSENEHAHKKSVDLRDLKNLFFLEPNTYDTYNERINEVCSELGFSPKRRVRYFGSMGRMGVTYGADEACIIPESMVDYIAEPEVSGLIRLPLVNENAYFEVAAVYLKSKQDENIAKCINSLQVATTDWADN